MNLTIRLTCILFLALACSSCESKNHSIFWNDSDYFCDGKTFSMIIQKEDAVQKKQFLEHGSGYRASSKSDVWMVQWRIESLKEGQTNHPARVIYLGHHEVTRSRGMSFLENESGETPMAFQANGENDFILSKSDKVRVYKTDGKTLGHLVATADVGEGRKLVFDRSRQHFFSWQPFPAIYASSNLTIVKKVPITEHFNAFEKEYSRTENHLQVLTDDLRYLIAVPHNGGESPQGWNHYKAYCFDLDSDTSATKKIHSGTNFTAISSIENVNGSLSFVTYSDSEKMAILNSESKLLTDLKANNTRPYNFNSNFHWDYHNDRSFTSEGSIDLDNAQREVVLNEYEFKQGKAKRFILSAGEMQIPKSK